MRKHDQNQFETIHSKLSSRDPGIRSKAIASFNQSGSKGIDLLVSMLRNHVLTVNVRIPRRKRYLVNVTAIAVPIAFFCLLNAFTEDDTLWIALIGAIVVAIRNALRQLPLLRIRYSLVQSMLLAEDSRLLFPLIGCVGLDEAKMLSWPRVLPSLCGKPADQSAKINQAIIRTLSRLNRSDKVTVTQLERSMLSGALRSHDTDLVLALLRFVENNGDGRELAIAKRLAKGHYSGARLPSIREAAACCVSCIELRSSRKAMPATLLRPSQCATQESTLVRPVDAAAPVEQAMLLRVAQKDD